MSDSRSQRLHELGARLRAGDPEAAFRLKQRQRGKKSAAVMQARGWPNLVRAWQARRARLIAAKPPSYFCPLCRNGSPCCARGDVKPPCRRCYRDIL
jgi:hypothetical protein